MNKEDKQPFANGGCICDVMRGHRATCGSSLTYRHAKRPAEVDVTLNDGLPQYQTAKATA